MECEFKVLMRKHKNDKTVQYYQRARLALFRAGSSLGLNVTKELRKWLDHLENQEVA